MSRLLALLRRWLFRPTDFEQVLDRALARTRATPVRSIEAPSSGASPLSRNSH